MIKKLCYALALVSAVGMTENLCAQIAISPILYGQNAHLPDTIGSQNWGGSFYSNVDEVKLSHAKVIRWGGNFVDRPSNGFTTTAQYLKLIDSCRANNMEPIITLPSNKSGFSANDAAAVVNTINGTYNRNVVYWIIGNEPDLYSPSYSTANIAAYIKSFSSAMRQASPISIKIIAPECAWYDPNKYAAWLGGADNIAGFDSQANAYYVDIISVHAYPMLDMNADPATRAEIIAQLRSSGNFSDDLADLNTKIASVNSGRSSSPLKIAVTEANMCYFNNTGELYGDDLNSNNTFIAGQFWVEMMQICMEQKVEFITFWSTQEGCSSCGGASNYATSHGYLHPGSWTDHPNGKKPTYYHYQMIAENFNGTYCAGNASSYSNVKAFGSKNGSFISVVVMNQDASADYNNITLDLNNATGIKINAGVNAQHTISIGDQTTKVFVFDLAGQMLEQCTYTVTDALNKVAPSCTTYTPCSPPTATAGSNGTVCQSATIYLTANTVASATYSWTGPDGWTSNSEDPTRVAGTSMSGTYTLTITAGGCTSAQSTTTVTVPQFSYISPNGNVSACTSVTLTGTSNPGGYTYQWKKDNVNISGATNPTYSASVTAQYQLKITNGSCLAWSSPVNVTIGGTASAPVASDNSPVCQSSTIMLYATNVAGASYYWTGPGAYTSTSQNPQRTNASYTMAGTYSVVAIVGSCTSAVATTYVDIPAFASIGVSTSTTFCANQSRECWLYASDGAGYSYQWIRNGSNITTNGTNDEYEAEITGDYQVRITRSDGCMAWSAPTYVNATTSHVATITPAGPTSVCSPGTVVLCGNGCNSYTYQWQKRDQYGNFQFISGATNINYTVTATGDYQIRTTIGGNHQWSAPVYCTINTGCRLENPEAGAAEPVLNTTALSVYPNPVNDAFAVTLSGMNVTEKNITIDVLDVNGKLVYTRSYAAVEGTTFQTNVDIDKTYGNGLYIVQATIGETVMHSRIVLAR